MANPVLNVKIKQVEDGLYKLSFDQVLTVRDYQVFFDGNLAREINSQNSIVLAGPRIQYIVTGVNADQMNAVTVRAVLDGQLQDASTAVNVTSQDNRLFYKETTTNLLAAGVFQAVHEDLLQYKTVIVTAFASHAGSVAIEQSGDGTNWDLVASVAVPATTGTTLTAVLSLRDVRITYTNGGTPQTTFRLFSTYIP